MTVRKAMPEDLPQVEALLAAAGLPLDGAPAAFAHGFVAAHDGIVAGAVALEPFRDGALLRSLVVDPSRRGTGLGTVLVEVALHEARALRMPAVYLLTTTADGFFAKLGFAVVPRAGVPLSVQESVEFRSACPASAVAMTIYLSGLEY